MKDSIWLVNELNSQKHKASSLRLVSQNTKTKTRRQKMAE